MLLSAWSLVQKSAKLYRENMKLFVKYVILLYLPSWSLALAFGAFAVYFATGGANSLQGLAGLGIATFILIVLGGILSLWFSLAFIQVIASRYQGKPTISMKQEIMQAKKFILVSILATILSALAILGGLILIIIPGIIFSVWFTFVIQAIVLDKKSAVDSLKASKNLVAGRWWGVLWRMLAPVLVVLGITWGVQLIALPFNGLGESNSAFAFVGALITLVGAVINALLVPFITSAQTILYLELKKHPIQDTAHTS